jgi:hypothetical protein
MNEKRMNTVLFRREKKKRLMTIVCNFVKEHVHDHKSSFHNIAITRESFPSFVPRTPKYARNHKARLCRSISHYFPRVFHNTHHIIHKETKTLPPFFLISAAALLCLLQLPPSSNSPRNAPSSPRFLHRQMPHTPRQSTANSPNC